MAKEIAYSAVNKGADFIGFVNRTTDMLYGHSGLYTSREEFYEAADVAEDTPDNADYLLITVERFDTADKMFAAAAAREPSVG